MSIILQLLYIYIIGQCLFYEMKVPIIFFTKNYIVNTSHKVLMSDTNVKEQIAIINLSNI